MSEVNEGNICAGIPVEMITVADPFGAIFKLQTEFLRRLGELPYQYESPRESVKKIIYYEHCILDELQEIANWFESPGDSAWGEIVKEVQMETIDVFHFVLNIGVELNMSGTDFSLFDMAYSYPSINITLVPLLLIDYTHVVRRNMLHLINGMPWKNWKKYPELSFEEYKMAVHASYGTLFHSALDLCIKANLSRQDLINVYYAKNKENNRRQTDGYGTGA